MRKSSPLRLCSLLLLLTGAVIGAQLGTKASGRLRGEELRGLLALMVLGVCAKIGIELVSTPEDIYSISETPGFGL